MMLTMKVGKSISSAAEDDLVKSIWQEIRSYLVPQREQVYEAIRSYPPPIPACDVQFNHLLEKRSRLAQELSRLNTLAKQNLPWREQVQIIEAFIAASTNLTEDEKQKIHAYLYRAMER